MLTAHNCTQEEL